MTTPSAERRIPWVWLFVGGLILLAVARQLLSPARRSVLVDKPAPGFSLPLAQPGGDRLRLDDLKGQVVLLDFWASWCGACRQATPVLNALHERYAERGVRVLGINTDASTAQEAAAAGRAFRAQYPSLFDPQHHAQAAYRVRALPTLVLVDATGVVRRVQLGVPDERRWAGYLLEVLESAGEHR